MSCTLWSVRPVAVLQRSSQCGAAAINSPSLPSRRPPTPPAAPALLSQLRLLHPLAAPPVLADPSDREGMQAEVQRLQGILEGLPTTMEQDQKLLEVGSCLLLCKEHAALDPGCCLPLGTVGSSSLLDHHLQAWQPVSAAQLCLLLGVPHQVPGAAALASCPDPAALQGETDWKRRAILELRVERKRGLRYRIEHLQELLAATAPGADKEELR